MRTAEKYVLNAARAVGTTRIVNFWPASVSDQQADDHQSQNQQHHPEPWQPPEGGPEAQIVTGVAPIHLQYPG